MSDSASSASDEDSAPESADEAEVTGTKPTLHVDGGFKWDVGPAGQPEEGVAKPQPSSDSEEEMENLEVGIIWNSFCRVSNL